MAPPPSSRPPESPARRALRTMLLLVFGLHVAAIAIFQLAGVERWPERWRLTFLGVWTALTVAIVGPGLLRIRRARGVGRRRR